MAANRVGKTIAGGCEVVYHATGRYPKWWTGYRRDKPGLIWTAGDTGKTTRDIIQYALLGPPGAYGTGLIPYDYIKETTNKIGLPEAMESIYVQHKAGGLTKILLKSYDQRREAFQGTDPEIIWLDEECPSDVYEECLLRTMTNDGRLFLTFTPLNGLTDVVRAFMDVK